ncbi:MAG: hypothetical protein ACHQ1D_00740 [Nitrososphaerales archaeon]
MKKESNWSFQFIQQYSQFLNPKHYNWITFTPFECHFEYDKIFYLRYEFQIILLGIGIWVSYCTRTPGKDHDTMMESLNEIKTLNDYYYEQIKIIRDYALQCKQGQLGINELILAIESQLDKALGDKSEPSSEN